MTPYSLPEDILEHDELEILVVVDNETDTLSSVDAGVPQVPEIIHLAACTPASRNYLDHECNMVFDQLCCACHGLSVLITGRHGGEQRSMLFDVGPYPDLWLDNARCLGIRGVTVFSACLHAGIVNACLSAKKHFRDSRIDLVLGGYHLAGKAMEPRIEPTVRDLNLRIEPRFVAPGHCTGWRAKASLANTFAPGRHAPSVVGTRFRLTAVAD